MKIKEFEKSSDDMYVFNLIISSRDTTIIHIPGESLSTLEKLLQLLNINYKVTVSVFKFEDGKKYEY